VYEKGGRRYARVTLDATTRPKIPLPTCATQDAAEARGALLADLARNLRNAKVPAASARTFLRRAGAAAQGKPLDTVLRAVEAVSTDKAERLSDASTLRTFRDVADRWTSGELARRHPDRVPALSPATAQQYRGMLENHIYPHGIGDKPIPDVTHDDAECVLAALPAELEASSRRRVAQTLARVLNLAALLRLRPDNPLPRGFLPKRGPGKAKAYVRPAEDARLLAYADVPFSRRLFYGFLHREGCRSNEAIGFNVGDVDDLGSIRLDENKTDDPRSWALGADVVRALRASFALRERALGRKLGADDPLFVDEDGARLRLHHAAARFRDDLRAAGIDRAVLFQSSKARRRVRLHDTRAAFVTLALACGRSEAWVTDRTGHKSSQMVALYKRTASEAADLRLGWFGDLDRAIPELAAAAPPPPATPPDGGVETAREGSGSGPTGAKGSERAPATGRKPGGSRGSLPSRALAFSLLPFAFCLRAGALRSPPCAVSPSSPPASASPGSPSRRAPAPSCLHPPSPPSRPRRSPSPSPPSVRHGTPTRPSPRTPTRWRATRCMPRSIPTSTTSPARAPSPGRTPRASRRARCGCTST
jgi:hypothetical protein